MKFKTIGKAAGGAPTSGAPAPSNGPTESPSLTRRSFLRNGSSAGVGVGLIVTSKTALGQEGKGDDGRIVKCGIIGYGDEGKALRESSLFLKDNVRFTAVADVWERNRRAGVGQIASANQGGGADGEVCNGYEDAQEMIEKEKDLDCVIVATPDFVHHTYTNMALDAGLHVYCEKLMSNSVESARSMVLAQRRSQKLLQIGHQRRSNPRYLHAKNELITKHNLLGWITHMTAQWNRARSGSLPREIPAGRDAIDDATLEKYGYNTGATGMFEFRNWRMFRKFGGGIISDLGAHQIDLFNWFLDAFPTSIFAQGGTDYYTGDFIHEYLTSGVKEAIAKNKSKKRAEKLQAELAVVEQIKNGYEHADNVMAFYEYVTPRMNWKAETGTDEERSATKGGSGDTLKTRAYYQVLTTSSSQKFYEKFMGEHATMAISELTEYNQIYREAHDERFENWTDLAKGATPAIQKDLTNEKIYHRFWEKPTPWRSVTQAKHDKWLDTGTLTDARVSKGLDPYELPDHVQFKERPHTPHLRNFFDAVRKDGSQDDLNCTAEEGFSTCVTCMKVHEALKNGGKLEFDPSEFYVPKDVT